MIIKNGKEKYRVYVKTIIHDYYGETHEETKVLGETFAVTAAKAISNIKYRLGIKKPVDTLYGPTVISKYYAERN